MSLASVKDLETFVLNFHSVPLPSYNSVLTLLCIADAGHAPARRRRSKTRTAGSGRVHSKATIMATVAAGSCDGSRRVVHIPFANPTSRAAKHSEDHVQPSRNEPCAGTERLSARAQDPSLIAFLHNLLSCPAVPFKLAHVSISIL